MANQGEGRERVTTRGATPPTTTPAPGMVDPTTVSPTGGEDYMSYLAATGQMPGVGSNSGVIPADLMQYLQASGEINSPRWKRLLAGNSPVGNAPYYGWEGADTPIRTRGVPTYGQTQPLVDTHTGQVVGPGGKVQTGTTQVPMVGANGTPLANVRAPIYFDGDAEVEFSKMSPEQRARTKQLMRDSGLLAEKAGGAGQMWDGAAFSAFGEILRYANTKGISWRVAAQSMSNYLKEHPEEKVTPSGATLPAFTPNVTNPDDLRKVYEQAAVKVLGRADPTTADHFVQAVQAGQVASQRANYNATYQAGTESGVGPGGTVVDAPDPGVTAEKMLRESNPGMAGGNDLANQFDNFMAIIGGSAGG